MDGEWTKHLDDLRGCLLKSLIGLLGGVVIAFLFVSFTLRFISLPYINFLVHAGLPTTSLLRSLAPTDTLEVTLRASILFGFVLSSPWIFYQCWWFIAPGLFQNERRRVLVLFSTLVFFFFTGVAFAYFVALPTTISFLYTFTTSMGIAPDWAIANYFSFVITFLVGFGLVFELPVAVVALNSFGIVTLRMLTHYRRHVIVAIFIVAAIITPGTDFVSQLIMALPLIALYEISIAATRIIEKARISQKEISKEEL